MNSVGSRRSRREPSTIAKCACAGLQRVSDQVRTLDPLTSTALKTILVAEAPAPRVPPHAARGFVLN